MPNIDLNVRPQGREDLASWYAAALEEQAESGLSMAEYAAELGVTPATLYSWRRRLCEEEHEGDPKRKQSGGLIQVSLDASSSFGEAEGFVVRIGRDRCVEVPRDFDGAALKRLVAVLEAC